MLLRGLVVAVAAFLAGQTAMMAQVSRSRSTVSQPPAQPPVPNDPLELVNGDAQPVQDAEQRAAAANLVVRARELSNVRNYPYDLKTTFVVLGAGAGNWSLEDTSPARFVYRWTAQGPSYSTINLRSNQLAYSNQAAGTMPLRLAQARTVMFFMYPMPGPHAALRTAAGSLNGAEVSCVLLSPFSPMKPTAGGRRWEEAEYCVDPKSGLLMTYSPVPGMYVAYDYAQAFHFHDKTIPGKFTITQAGQTVVEARTENVSDPGKLDPAIFQPAGLEKIGAGAFMTPPWRVRTVSTAHAADSNGMQIVVLDGMVSPQGELGEVQVLASSNAALNQAALDETAGWKNWPSQADDQPGATPQSHEVFFTVAFSPAQKRPLDQ